MRCHQRYIVHSKPIRHRTVGSNGKKMEHTVTLGSKQSVSSMALLHDGGEPLRSDHTSNCFVVECLCFPMSGVVVWLRAFSHLPPKESKIASQAPERMDGEVSNISRVPVGVFRSQGFRSATGIVARFLRSHIVSRRQRE